MLPKCSCCSKLRIYSKSFTQNSNEETFFHLKTGLLTQTSEKWMVSSTHIKQNICFFYHARKNKLILKKYEEKYYRRLVKNSFYLWHQMMGWISCTPICFEPVTLRHKVNKPHVPVVLYPSKMECSNADIIAWSQY